MVLLSNETTLKSVLPSFKFIWPFFDKDIFVHYVQLFLIDAQGLSILLFSRDA